MTERIEKLQKSIRVEKYQLCIEKSRLITQSFKNTEGEPMGLEFDFYAGLWSRKEIEGLKEVGYEISDHEEPEHEGAA